MNLSPHWVDVLTGAGFAASHWSILGVGDAPDVKIMNLAAA
jgi:predicted nuclease of predicted toxin-antitoxin system